MLFKSSFIKFIPRVEYAVDSLFQLAFQNQTHPQDLLLILENGFFHPLLENSQPAGLPKLSPYTIGPGYLGHAENTQYQFYDHYRREIYEDREGIISQILKDEKLRNFEEISIHLELFLYLKFWESDMIIKMLYMLSQLIQKKPFDWHFVIEKHNGTGINKHRKGIPFIISSEVRDQLYAECPTFAFLIECIYNEGLRNAAAHSQYSFQGRYLHTYKFDKKANDYVSNYFSFSEWEEYSHMTIIFYNMLLKNMNHYRKYYTNLAKGKHFGLPVRIIKADKTERTEFYTYDGDRWCWYSNTDQGRGVNRYWV